MASLTPGILLKLIRNIGSDVKIVGAHRSVLLQVIAIAPSLTGCEELCPSHGFFLKLSDSSYATYVSLSHNLDDIILSNKMQLGQFIYVEKLEPGCPLPVLTRLKLIAGRHPFVGTPDDLVCVNTSGLFHNVTAKTLPVKQYFSLTKIGKTLLGSGSFANPCVHPQNQIVASQLDESHSPSLVADEPSVVTVSDELLAQSLERRSFPRASWSSQKDVVEIFHQKGRIAKSLVSSDASLNSATYSPLREVRESSSPCLHRVHRDEPESIVFSFNRASNGNPTSTSDRKKLMHPDQGKKLPYRGTPSVMRSANPLYKSIDIGMSHDRFKKSFLHQNHWKQSLHSNASYCGKGLNIFEDTTKACEKKAILNNDSSKKGADLYGKRDVPETLSSIYAQLYDRTTPLCDMDMHLKTSWSNMPLALSSLGQEVMLKHSQAQKDIAKALQQISVTDRIIKNMSDFADLCSLQKLCDHQQYIRRFLEFYELLLQSTAIAETLAEEKPGEINIVSEKKKQVAHMRLDGKMQGAMKWSDGVLSSDLRQSNVFKEHERLTRFSNCTDSNDHPCDKNKIEIPNHPVFTSASLVLASPTSFVSDPLTMNNGIDQYVLSSSAQSNILKRNSSDVRHLKSNVKTGVSSNLHKPDSNPSTGKQSIRPPSPRDRKNYTTDLTKIGYLKQTIKLAKDLQYAAENWFMKFMTDALQSGFQTVVDDPNKRCIWSVNDSGILEDLRKVNDWLDQISAKHKGQSNSEVLDRIYCLKQNLYEFLIQLCLQKPVTSST